MAYNTNKLEAQSIEAINKHKLFFIEDVVAFIPCSKETFYNHRLHESDGIKAALAQQRIEVKVSMRSKWYRSSNAALQMGLMKLIASDEERKRLSQQYTDITTDGEKLPAPILGGLSAVSDNDSDKEAS